MLACDKDLTTRNLVNNLVALSVSICFCSRSDCRKGGLQKEKIMKLLVAMFVMMCLFVGVAVFPVMAQDAPAAPVLCTADQVKQVVDLALPFGDQMNTVASGNYPQTLEGDTTKMLDWSDLYVSFFNDVYPSLPDCIDGIAYGNAVGLMLNRQMNLETIIVLNGAQNAMNTGDADVNQALQPAFDIQNELAKVGVSAVNAVVNLLQTGTGIPNWLPDCTADDAELGTQLADLEHTYAGLQPSLQAYLDEGTVDKETYISLLNLVNDMATVANANPEPCNEYYFQLANDLYIFNDTLTTLTLAQIVPYVSDSDNAERLNTLLEYCNGALNSYINGATDTSTADS
jgi:hypothetical protein